MAVSTYQGMTTAILRKQNGFDVYGKAQTGPDMIIPVSPIRFEPGMAETSVRTDRSGSQSASFEASVIGRFLIDPSVSIYAGDQIEFQGVKMRVLSTYPRIDFDGDLHHTQVDLTSWLPA